METGLDKFLFAAALLTGLAAAVPASVQDTMGTSSSDVALAANVKSALLQAPPFQDTGVDIQVTASHGKVDLSGWVSYRNDAGAAREVAASVGGVTAVTAHCHSWSTDADYRV